MHEFGLVESFMDAVLRRAGGRRVIGVKVRVGALHRVVEESLVQAFTFVSVGTVADGARVELVTMPVRLSCPACATVTQAAEVLPDCPACGEPSPEVTGGDELILESITLAAGEEGDPLPVGEAVPGEPDDGHTHDGHTHDGDARGLSGGRTPAGVSHGEG